MFRSLILLFTAFCSSTLLAASSSISISYEQVATYARQHNRELKAARLRIAEAEARLLGAGRWANPEFGFDAKTNKGFNEGTVAVSIDQRFPLTSRLRLERALSRQMVTAAHLEIREQERLLIAEAESLFVKLLAIEAQHGLRERQIELSRRLTGFIKDRAVQGELSPLDAAQAQVDSERLILETRKMSHEKLSLLGELKPKLGIPAETSLILSGSLPTPATLKTKGNSWEDRPDFQIAKVKEAAAQTEIRLAEARKWEEITVGGIWEHERTRDESTGFLGMKLSLPLPLWNRNEGEIAEKKASASRAALETKALVTDITNQMETARAEMAVNAELIHETNTKLLPLLNEQMEKIEKAYQSGQSDLLTLLRVRDQRLQIETAALEATRDFHLARIRYEAATAKHSSTSSRPTSPGKTR